MPRFCCPHCHTSHPVEGFDRAFSADASYLICPECDYCFLSPLAMPSQAAATEPSHTPEDRQPCLLSV